MTSIVHLERALEMLTASIFQTFRRGVRPDRKSACAARGPASAGRSRRRRARAARREGRDLAGAPGAFGRGDQERADREKQEPHGGSPLPSGFARPRSPAGAVRQASITRRPAARAREVRLRRRPPARRGRGHDRVAARRADCRAWHGAISGPPGREDARGSETPRDERSRPDRRSMARFASARPRIPPDSA